MQFNNFEAYNVYRATDPTFNEIKTITDAFGNPLLFEAMENRIQGFWGLRLADLGFELIFLALSDAANSMKLVVLPKDPSLGQF